MSRRRARPEGAEVLAGRPFPVATPRMRRAAAPVLVPSGWPAGAPPPPVRRQQLWGLDGTGGQQSVAEQDDWLQRAAAAVRALEAGRQGERVEGRVWLAELMPLWARGCARVSLRVMHFVARMCDVSRFMLAPVVRACVMYRDGCLPLWCVYV